MEIGNAIGLIRSIQNDFADGSGAHEALALAIKSTLLIKKLDEWLQSNDSEFEEMSPHQYGYTIAKQEIEYLFREVQQEVE